MAGKIGNEDAQALFGKGARDVAHDDVVGRNAVEENDGADFRVRGQIFAFDRENLHAAGGGVNDVALLGVAAGGKIDEAATHNETENADERAIAPAGGGKRKRSP